MLEAVNISHSFPGPTVSCRQALRDVSLRMKAGDTVLLTGPSGSGKTTLARILAGLQPPLQGSVLFNSVELYGRSRGAVAARAGLVLASQYPERQFFAATVREEISWGLRFALGLAEAQIQESVARISRELDFPLAALGERSPRALSSGEQRKVALLSLLALEPRLLILDEPLASLSGRESQRLVGLLRRWHGPGRALLIISHPLELFLPWVSAVAVLGAGRLIFWGSPTELCQSWDFPVADLVCLPPLVAVSRHLKEQGLSDGQVGLEAEVIFQQVVEAVAKIRGRQGRELHRR